MRSVFAVAGHRNALRPAVRYAGKPVESEVMAAVWTFFAVYVLLAAGTALVLSASISRRR